MRKKTTFCVFLLLFFIFSCEILRAQTDTKQDSMSIVQDSVKVKKNVFKRIYEYFEKSNEVKSDKKFDFSIVGGPHYSSDTKLGIGMVASGLYRIDRSDMNISPSNVSLYADITTTGSYVLGIGGNTIFPKMKYRIDYDLFFFHRPGRYYGIGYDAGDRGSYSKYDNQGIQMKVDFLTKILDNTFVGITGDFKNMDGRNFENMTFLEGLRSKTTAVGAGVIVSYDSRDFIPNPYKGIYAKVEQIFYPKFLGSTYNHNKTELTFRYYRQAWKGAVIAYDLQGVFNNGDPAWNMLATLGGSYQMRGYYSGQYRDKKMVQTQIELRQRIYKRSGAVAWVGVGNIFPEFSSFKWKHTLPTYGIGYRWEFKNRVNVRLDYGFGKGQSGFYFNINEAF